ncbi:hypothetical protein EFK32_06105 [Lactococcus lactis subsp. lactis]|nr:hypothetical protein [Lactococcus lactis subsp. lactis]
MRLPLKTCFFVQLHESLGVQRQVNEQLVALPFRVATLESLTANGHSCAAKMDFKSKAVFAM